jgi:hypothetical protein
MGRSHFAEWVLSSVVAPPDREAAVGDLDEEYALRLTRGSCVRAECWYWTQVLRSVPWFLLTPIRRGGWLGTIFVAVAACVVQAAVEVCTGTAIQRLAAQHRDVTMLAGLIVVLSSLALVSYLAALVRPGAATLLTLIAVVAVSFQLNAQARVGLLSLASIATAIAAPSAAFAGGALSLRSRNRTEGK